MKYQFILNNLDNFTVERMCKCMKVSRNAYYNWIATKDDVVEKETLVLLKERIRSIFQRSRQIYGSHRIQKMLERESLFYSRSYVACLMKEMGLKSILRRKYIVTTNSNHSFEVAENRLNRDFTSSKLGKKWVSDITYIRVNNDWNYLTTIIDLADRKIIGWSLSEDMTTENTVLKAWLHARSNRSLSGDFVFHSDRGIQYTSSKMVHLFSFNRKITQSMSRKGNCWDNAVAESFFKTIKNEWLYRFKYTSYSQLYRSVADYINWYNTERIHSSLGYLSPLEMEIKLREKANEAA
jgi:transposase InsO family protein